MSKWTREEIRLTRYAWYLHEIDRLERRHKLLRVVLIGLGVAVGIVMGVITNG